MMRCPYCQSRRVVTLDVVTGAIILLRGVPVPVRAYFVCSRCHSSAAIAPAIFKE